MRRALLILVAACGENEHRGNAELVIVAASPHVAEAGGTTTFTVSLATPPSHDVTLAIHSSDPRAAIVDPVAFVITPVNRARLVTVTGVDDAYVRGLREVELEITGPGVAATALQITVGDDDVAAAIVAPSHGLVTTEDGTRATFDVRLAAKPYDDVTLALDSTNPAEGMPEQTHVAFTPSNWDLPQTVGVRGGDDDIADGPQPYQITIGPAASSDLAFAAMQSVAVDAVNADDDHPAIVAVPAGGLVTTETGGTATFSLALASRPLAAVTIPLAAVPAGEVALAPAIVIAPEDWNVPHEVVVTGLDDGVIDGDRDVSIDLGPASSADPSYAGLPGGHVHATNLGTGDTIPP